MSILQHETPIPAQHAVQHPSWCEPKLCTTFPDGGDELLVTHRLALLDEPLAGGARMVVDLIRGDSLCARGGELLEQGPGRRPRRRPGAVPGGRRAHPAAYRAPRGGLGLGRPYGEPRRGCSVIPAFPTQPAEVPDGAPVAELVASYSDHLRVVLVNGLQLDDPEAGDEVVRHGLAALALLHALVDRLQASRWATMRDVLASDVARAPEVAAACALDGSEVAAGLRSWAAGQHRKGLMADWEVGVVDLMARTVEGGSR